ncbi:DNA-binding response regulator, NarL/FixJ family, contains REC and HTH domains [Spirosomataceae bacterium TFI 002]|nr:DNA-binding response regulator, NarL/FixJ family, contains REC and HTH domains [Spirosomataceae bacterium TFI 002]
MIKIAIVDDHQLFREGLASMFAKNDSIQVLASFGDGSELLSYLEKDTNIDVLLLDISMPVLGGLEVLKIVKKKYPLIKCIILSMHNDGNYVVQSVRNGALGYLLKNADQEELLQAIETVSLGKKYFNKETTELLINNMSKGGETVKKLSTRESEILTLIASGLTTKEIAEKLFVSTRTVETHRVNMMKKLNVKNSAELIRKASELDLL